MRVAFVAPEVAPFSKTGGLADVAGALPRVLSESGVEIATVSPLYRCVRRYGPEATPHRLVVPMGGAEIEVTVARAANHYFLEYDPYFDRDELYGLGGGDYPDNASRFILLCRGAMELLERLGAPDVIHAHDWQAGLVPIYAKTLYAPAFGRTRTVFTIHNMAYQGLFWHWDMPLTGLGWKHFNWEEMEFWGKISFLKAGLVHADALTTVSPTYAREIQTEEMGCGLHDVLRARARSLHGILNGADYSEWDPGNDRLIAAPYDRRAPTGKAKCKAALQELCGLPVRKEAPVAAMIGRLAAQKGIDLFLRAADAVIALGLQVVVLGTGEERYRQEVADAGARHPGRFSVNMTFNEALAHRILAGSDLFLMPSRYEPCGLAQLYSLRYGTVPVVHATGGLADTVQDGRTGFTFRDYTAEAFLEAVGRALRAWADRAAWRRLMAAGMKEEFSWQASARRYLALYESLVGPRA